MTDPATPLAPPENAHLSRKFNIPGDVVNQATEDLPDDQRNMIRWFHGHCFEQDLSLADASKLCRYDESTLHRVFRGKYEGNMQNVCSNIAEFRKIHEERSKGRKLTFVETALARRIWRICDAAREFQRIGFIFGDTQTGKTTALEKYRDDNNHGSTVYLRMPTGGAMNIFMADLACAMRISAKAVERELRRRILASFDDRMLLIVDEAHQCITAGTRSETNRCVRPIEFIREIHDVAKCGVVICATNIFRDEMENGMMAGMLKQCKRRRLAALQLPSTPTAADLNAFTAAYGLEAAAGDSLKLQTDVIRDEALGMWLTLLRMAAKMAVKASTKLAWSHVHRAYTSLRALESCK